MLFDRFGNVVAEVFGRPGSLLLRVGEDAQPFETYLAHERQQFFEIGLRLARITHQQRRAQRDAGHLAAHFFHQRIGFRFVQPAPHAFELAVADVLERNIQVFADFRLIAHCADHVIGELGRIGIVKPEPFDSVDAAKPAQQVAEPAFAVKVQPVIGRVLCDDDQLFYSAVGQSLRFGDELFHRHRDVSAPD